MRAQIVLPSPGNDARVRLDGKSVQGERVGGYVVLEDVGSGTHYISSNPAPMDALPTSQPGTQPVLPKR